MGICIISRFAFAGRFTGDSVPVTLSALHYPPMKRCSVVALFESLHVSIKSRPLAGTRQGACFFMDLEGFEPLTSRMRTERSTN